MVEETLIVKHAGISPDSPAAAAISHRSNILSMSEEMISATLAPTAPGGLRLSLRAALAARIAAINDEDKLAAHYLDQIIDQSDKAVADPDFDGGNDPWLRAVLCFSDLVSSQPSETSEHDISKLKAVGMEDADIVRLAELLAFLAYQIRVIVGLRLMSAAQ